MKFIVGVLGVLLLCACGRTRVIENPSCEKWNTLYVNRVELSDTATLISIVACGREGDWLNLEGDENGEIYLLGRESGRKYMYRGSSNFEVGKRQELGASGNMFMTLRFEPVAKEEEIIDVVTDRSEEFCVRGVRLQTPDSIRCLPVCRLQGELKGFPETEALMLWKWLDYDISREMGNVQILPVINGQFECKIPVENADDYYVLIPWNQFARSAFTSMTFFAEVGKLELCWEYDSIPIIKGSKLNRMVQEAEWYNQSVINEYIPLMEKMGKEGKHILPHVWKMLMEAENTLNIDQRMKVYNIVNGLSYEEKYVPEYVDLTRRYDRAMEHKKDSLLDIMQCDIQLAYLPWLLKKIRREETYNEKLQPIAASYAEHFKEYALGKRLAEKVEAARTYAGGQYLDFEAPDREGTMHRFSEMIEGSRLVILDCWASWCGGCRSSSRNMKPLYKKYRNKGLSVVSVAREFKNLNALDKAVAMDGYEWPVLVELDDRIGLWYKYGIGDGGGSVLLIDPKTKKILARNPAFTEIEDKIKEYCR